MVRASRSWRNEKEILQRNPENCRITLRPKGSDGIYLKEFSSSCHPDFITWSCDKT